ncbi:hypothetical protein SAMN02745945_02401 [Peptoclostridium litorale DSM 5388]|uniref:Uncharacterized protein n=1 Tax=Peptoclostridium litorale DSM 5388 TaxID=1121324 RepID=A0A069RJJ5_PEPLI|nr:hypothetical protein [Peptoclostridium litorale]KDR96320.1 hypothetical protein CLIT_4c01570 [Peptoclostridium litorale DSM 5388]SIO26316.1 hypothetical protein SAMN02745945_02401 [Peptoclostridium litorale DSM 5388]
MDWDFLRSCDYKTRETLLRGDLTGEKCKVLDKYGLTSNSRLYWEKIQEKYPTQEYFSHKLARKSTVIGMIFHIHRLCFAKVKYFENNWDDYEPCKYIWDQGGFVNCELYDMEAIRQKATGIVIDLRDLARIKWLRDFHAMCTHLEQKKEEAVAA